VRLVFLDGVFAVTDAAILACIASIIVLEAELLVADNRASLSRGLLPVVLGMG
jgi:hypothetical protein